MANPVQLGQCRFVVLDDARGARQAGAQREVELDEIVGRIVAASLGDAARCGDLVHQAVTS
ncbi:MAG: hypothetical protein VB138_04870 [Burkholderia sp.]